MKTREIDLNKEGPLTEEELEVLCKLEDRVNLSWAEENDKAGLFDNIDSKFLLISNCIVAGWRNTFEEVCKLRHSFGEMHSGRHFTIYEKKEISSEVK